MSNYAPTTHDAPTAYDPYAVVQRFEEPDIAHVLGGAITIRLRSQDTDGRVGMIEQIVPGGFPGPALHVHPNFEETFYVLGGTLVFPGGRGCPGGRRGDGRAHPPGRAPHVRQPAR